MCRKMRSATTRHCAVLLCINFIVHFTKKKRYNIEFGLHMSHKTQNPLSQSAYLSFRIKDVETVVILLYFVSKLLTRNSTTEYVKKKNKQTTSSTWSQNKKYWCVYLVEMTMPEVSNFNWVWEDEMHTGGDRLLALLNFNFCFNTLWTCTYTFNTGI